MKLVLFQGDSITDGCRSRTQDWEHGDAYCTLLNAEITYNYPGQYDFLNRGCAGNRIVDLYARIKPDIIHLKPDILSILIGVNDVWHEFAFQNGIEPEKFYLLYDLLIDEVKSALPDTKIIIMEPFALKGSHTEQHWDEFYAKVRKLSEESRKIAAKYGFPFVELQDKFEAAQNIMPNDYWLRDGVHPTMAGNELIAKEWMKAFKALEDLA